MRFLAFACLLTLAGCLQDPDPKSSTSRRSESREVCPGNCCWGMHSYTPPSTCERCGAKGLATTHRLCIECSRSESKCPHCLGKIPPPAKAPAPPKAETPPPKEEPPRKEEPPKKPEPPPAPPEPKADVPRRSQDLIVEPVDLSDSERQNHSVLVFAAQADRARLALEAHRSRKEKVIAELPPAKAGAGAGLYLVWGHFPQPNITEKNLKAGFDAESGMIRVSLPPFSGHRPQGGIGMDWGVDRRRTWSFVGFRVKLEDLPAGDYAFEVLEVESKDAEPRKLSEGRFNLAR